MLRRDISLLLNGPIHLSSLPHCNIATDSRKIVGNLCYCHTGARAGKYVVDNEGRPTETLARYKSNQGAADEILALFDPDGQRVRDMQRVWGYASGIRI